MHCQTNFEFHLYGCPNFKVQVFGQFLTRNVFWLLLNYVATTARLFSSPYYNNKLAFRGCWGIFFASKYMCCAMLCKNFVAPC